MKYNNSNNGFRVRFGVRRRHRGPPFALGYHQFIILVAIQDEGEGEGRYTSRVGNFHVFVRVKKKTIWWKKVRFNEERNKGKVGQDRSGRGREFQLDWAANAKICRMCSTARDTISPCHCRRREWSRGWSEPRVDKDGDRGGGTVKFEGGKL